MLFFSQGAFWGLMTGLVVGVARMVLEFSYDYPSCGQDIQRPAILDKVHYLYFAMILFTLTSLVIIGVSMITSPIPKEHVSNMPYTFTLFIVKCTNTLLTHAPTSVDNIQTSNVFFTIMVYVLNRLKGQLKKRTCFETFPNYKY